MRVAFALCGFAGGVTVPTLCTVTEHGGLKHYTVSNVVLSYAHTSALRASTYHEHSRVRSHITPIPIDFASQGAEVMIGNSVLEPEATHNQTLPTVTMMSLLAMLPHW